MLKHEVKNFFSYFTKTLSVCFKWNTTRTDLVMCNYVWLEQLNDCAKFFQVKVFVLLDKMRKLYKVVQNPRHWLLQYKCYIYINVLFISSPKDGLLKFGKFEFRHVSSFRHGIFSDKNTATFWHNFARKVNNFVLHYIWKLWLMAYENYSKFCTRKCKK